MAPPITLLFGSIVARVAGWLGLGYVTGWTVAIAVGLAAVFVVTGIAHFAPPLRRDLIAIVPPRLPAPACSSRSPECWNSWAPWGCCFPPRGWRQPGASCC
jgi:hypothetical protein